MQEEARLGDIIRADPHLTAALEAARDIEAPDWLVSAGAIRDAVWDALHGRPPVPPRDVDLSFFDPGDLTPARDEAVTAALLEREPALSWDAANQAAVHLWYPQRFGLRGGGVRFVRRRVEEKGWRERWPGLRFS